MESERQVPLIDYIEYPADVMMRRAEDFMKDIIRRRSVREFSDRPLPKAIIEMCLKAAGSAPSGANKQPWHFVVVSDPGIKKEIRLAAEAEESEFYSGRAPKEWLDAVKPFGTDQHKPFLETAPYLIAVFARSYNTLSEGKKDKNYYVQESVGIATGILITAIHNAGLASLTHTPSPMKFLNEILGRPENERPFLLLVVGYPATDATVPAIEKKKLEDYSTFI